MSTEIEQNIQRIERELAQLKNMLAEEKLPQYVLEERLRHPAARSGGTKIANYAVIDRKKSLYSMGRVVCAFFSHGTESGAAQAKKYAQQFADQLNAGV